MNYAVKIKIRVQGLDLLNVGACNDKPVLWVRVNPETKEKFDANFVLYTNSSDINIPKNKLSLLGTVQIDVGYNIRMPFHWFQIMRFNNEQTK